MILIAKDLCLKEFNLKTATTDDWTIYHLFRNILHQEQTPDDPFSPDHVIQTDLQSYSENNEIKFSLYKIIENNLQEQVGFLMLSELTSQSELYEDNKHIIFFKIDLLHAHLTKEIFEGIIGIINNRALKSGKTTLITTSFNPAEIEVMSSLGGQIAQAGVENRLYVENIDWEMIDNWTNIGSIGSSNNSIKIF